MALYEYQCEIHQTFEVQQSMKDEPLTSCPHCAKENIDMPVKRLISLSSFQLNGGGWASSGYSNK